MVASSASLARQNETIDPRTLPRANVRRSDNPFPPSDYVTVRNVPVFAEHQTKSRDGRELIFGPTELKAVADRCNRRISETGDYAAISVGHTSDPSDPNPTKPEVIGNAGPFRLGLLGEPGQRQRYCILADFHIRRDRLRDYEANPRRSPELWLEDSYGEMFLDPISLLGAEAPRLDMGLAPLVDANTGTDGAVLYSAIKAGRFCEKYAAAGPSCTSVFVPAEGDSKPSDTQHYAADFHNEPSTVKENFMLQPEEIRQIVDAIEGLDWVVAVKDLLTTEQQEHAGAPGAPGAVPTETPAVEQPLPGDSAAPAAPAPVAPAADATPTGMTPAPASEPAAAPADVTPAPAPAADEPKKSPLDDMSEEDIDKYVKGRFPQKYAAGSDPGTNPPTNATTIPTETKVSESSAEVAKYSALQAKINELEEDRIQRTNESRKSKLVTLRYHRAFDIDKEVERCRYAKMNDAAFAEHCNTIYENYTPTCANSPMPVPDEISDGRLPAAAVRTTPEKYTKEICSQAVVFCEQNPTANYAVVLENLVNGRPAS
jgi:hypothetical protein